MPEGRPALEYLRGRGLTDETIAQFHLGFALDQRGSLKAALMRDGFTEERLIEAGLLIRPEEGATYDRFRGRVIFPIADRQGRTIAFGGRVLGQGEPKYLNSPETPLFHKGSTLYGLPHALGPARTAGEIVVVEGYMDVIGLHQAGIRNAVAPLGTALTEDQIRLLWRIVPEPVLCFDGDTAGERAALRAIERALPMLTPGFSLRFAFIPAGEDPDSFVRRRGADAARKLLGQPLALSETLWLFETAGGTPATPEARADLKKRLLQHAARIQDEDLRRGFNQHFGDRVWREFSAARGAGAGGAFARGPKAAEARIPGRMALGHGVTARVQAERVMLALVVNQPGLFAEIEEELGTARFTETALDRLRQGLLGALGRAPEGWTVASVPELLADAALEASMKAAARSKAGFCMGRSETSEGPEGLSNIRRGGRRNDARETDTRDRSGIGIAASQHFGQPYPWDIKWGGGATKGAAAREIVLTLA
jgi:DNA primase